MASKKGKGTIDPFIMKDSRINFVAVPEHVEVLKVLMLGDLHAGHVCHSEELLDYYLGLLKADPDMRCILLGDLIECHLRTSKGKPSHQVKSIPEQRRYLVEKLGPIADRIDGAVPGNHEERQSDAGGDDITEVILNEIGCRHYFDPVGMVAYYTEKQRHVGYTVGLRHGSAGGQMIGSGLNGASKDVLNMVADVYVEGHCHKCTEGPKQGALKADWNNRCGSVRTYKVITNGSLLDPRISYAAMKGYPWCLPEQGVLLFNMKKCNRAITMVRQ